jgi:hypothetical protein
MYSFSGALRGGSLTNCFLLHCCSLLHCWFDLTTPNRGSVITTVPADRPEGQLVGRPSRLCLPNRSKKPWDHVLFPTAAAALPTSTASYGVNDKKMIEIAYSSREREGLRTQQLDRNE